MTDQEKLVLKYAQLSRIKAFLYAAESDIGSEDFVNDSYLRGELEHLRRYVDNEEYNLMRQLIENK